MGITWPQIQLEGEIVQEFKTPGFPTNILIFPDGRECLVTGSVSDSFFDMYVR